MKSVKFLHCADMHLDAPFTSLASYEKVQLRQRDLKEVFKRIIDAARDENVDILLVSGDLYEHNYVKKSTVELINDAFSSIKHIKVFIAPGNHDPYIPGCYYEKFKWSDNVHILAGESCCIKLDDMGVCIYGAGFGSFYEERTLISGIAPVDEGCINILLTHGTVDMNFKASVYNPMSGNELAALNMDYIALGHFHNRIEDIGGYGVVYNPGSPEALGFDEPGEHGAFMGSIYKDNEKSSKLDLRFLTLGKRFYEQKDINIGGCCSEQQVISKIEDAICLCPAGRPGGKKPADGLYSVTIRGSAGDFKWVKAELIENYFRDKLFFLKLANEAGTDYNIDEIINEPGLRGLFVRKVLKLMDQAQGNHDRELLHKAMHYGLEALEKGRVDIDYII
ncbi:DNA repair exonuclease SbcCD nuclease subunit [Anaerobacterium chartisolvens]|uniref:DNA repair exonuclease SbcCD nuclease subunit n=1 Tax=Anaerobacterium chartisolvens TaxID=1297424 RepID=A0A369B3B4_9FIRM|nr:DNA repair exonuclease [Anaerobacterium chartisolvens]RCX16072.1 DNA repair exonuclease SbcCD nuclease subunit [Anaerobacterium chartisolvens]